MQKLKEEAVLIDKNRELKDSIKDIKAIIGSKPEDKERYENILRYSN